MGSLPSTFRGTPQDLASAMVTRMEIQSPSGTNFIFTGDVEPTSNVGPWLKNGTQWYVWSSSLNQYVPQDLSASITIPFFISNSQPPSTTPPVWLQTTQDATDQDPNNYGEPIGWFVWDGAQWTRVPIVPASGPTISRPATPADFTQFYDTDISCLIWWERGAWRTVSGVLGDLKFVSATSQALAKAQNPGWEIFGDSNSALYGFTPFPANSDQGGGNPLPANPGTPHHIQGDQFGAGTFLGLDGTSSTQYQSAVALFLMRKL